MNMQLSLWKDCPPIEVDREKVNGELVSEGTRLPARTIADKKLSP
jgi:hypothetical protein